MPLSNQQTPVYPDLLDPAESNTLNRRDRVPSTLDRSILGIPAEEDEYTRGLTFFFDPSTGQPSVHSTSEESEDPGQSPPYELSQSSSNTDSNKVFTPQSVSDASGGLHPRTGSSRSVKSSDGGTSDGGAISEQSPSLSALATAGASKATLSPLRIQTPTDPFVAGSSTASTMSPAVDSPMSQPFGPFHDASDPRAVIDLTRNDIRYLEEIVSLGNSNRLGSSARLSDRMDPMDMDAQNDQSTALGPSRFAEGPKRDHGKSSQRTDLSPYKSPTRTQKGPRPRPDPTGQRISTKDALEKARSIEKAKLMRQIGVCLPCLVNHEPCAPGPICPKCLKSLTSSKIQKTPCVRPHLSGAELFRTGALSFPEGPPEISDWVSKRNVPLLLYNVGPAQASVSPDSRPRLNVICREFPETPGIRSFKSWTKGESRVDIPLPNFAMTRRQCSETAKNLDALVEAEYIKLVAELATDQDDIVSSTLAEAVRQADKCWPIKGALQLSILSRLASKSFNIFGQETLGIRQEQDPECPYYQRIPIPPLLDTQLDFLLMEKMKTLKKSVLSELRRMIAGQGRKHWFKIYLTMSVLLLNLESVYQNQCRQIKRYQEPTQKQRTMLESWKDAAQNLIDHFRAVCRGHIPLNMVWSKADQDVAEVDDRSLDFISRLNGIAQSRGEELYERSKASPDTPLVWISALFASKEEV